MCARRGQGGLCRAHGQNRKRDRLEQRQRCPLLAYAERSFDVFVTIDKRLEQQLDLKRFKLGFVIARVPSSEIGSYRPIFAALQDAAQTVKRGEVLHVLNPRMRGISR